MPDKPHVDDPWADLYADLGVTERPAPPVRVEAVADDDLNAEPQDDDENGDDDADGEGADGAPPELDENGNPKKRKRRRRRRAKKKGDDVVGPAPTLYVGNDAPPRQPAHAPVETDDAEPSEDSDESDEPEEAAATVSALEGGTSEMTRELIANWNVPSWEEIVVGLYRPER